MNDPVPALPQGVQSDVDNPEVGETCGDQESTQARRVRQVAFMQMKSSTFLIREQRLDFESFTAPSAGFFNRGHVRDGMDRLFTIFSPPVEGENGVRTSVV